MPEGLLPSKLFGEKTPAAFAHIHDLRERPEAFYWAKPRAVLCVTGFLTLVAGGVIAQHAEVGVFTDGVQGIGIFFIILGVMMFTTSFAETWMEILLEGDAPCYIFLILPLTIAWSVITGIVLACSEEFARRLVGLLTIMAVLVLVCLLLWYKVLLVVSEHFEMPADRPPKDSDPGNVYNVLALASFDWQDSADSADSLAEPPSLWQLLFGKKFKAWAALYTKGLFWSLVLLSCGVLLKTVDNDVLEIPELAVDAVHAVGELLTCGGAVGMLVSVAASIAEFLPAETLVEDISPHERVRNRVACACITVPSLIFNTVWLVARGADVLNHSDAIMMRCMAAVLLVGGGLLALAASLHVALVVFGATLTEELGLRHGTTPGDGDGASLPLPPDVELLPFPPIAMHGLHEELRCIGVGPYEARQVLQLAPWRAWWHWKLLPAYLAGPLALLSGIIAAVRTELLDPAPSAWIELLLPSIGEVLAVCAALSFLLAASTCIHFLPVRSECEAILHFFNFIWCAARATHTFTFDEASLRLAGTIVMIIALQEMRLSLKAALILAAKLTTLNEDEVKQFGKQPHTVPILHLASLLVNGGRWSIQEFQRELSRDAELLKWNRGVKTSCLGCLIVAFFGGMLKDDIMLPVLDLMLAKKMLDEDKHQDLHAHVLKPIGNILAGIGAVMLMQRLAAPLAESILWILRAGGPNRVRCATVIAMGFNAMWLVTYGVFICGSEFRGERIVGILLITLATIRCGAFLGGGLLLHHTEKGQADLSAMRYMVEDPAGEPGAKGDVAAASVGRPEDARLDELLCVAEDSLDYDAAEDPIPSINSSTPHRPGHQQTAESEIKLSKGFLQTPEPSRESSRSLVTPTEKPAPHFEQWSGQIAKETPVQVDHWQPLLKDMRTQGSTGRIEPAAPDNAEVGGISPTVLGITLDGSEQPPGEFFFTPHCSEGEAGKAPANAQAAELDPPQARRMLLEATHAAAAPADKDPQVDQLPLLVQIGILEPGATNKTWLMTPLGRAWMLANFIANGWFFVMGAILQGNWSLLRDGQVDEHVLVAALGAALMLLSAINALVCLRKLYHILEQR